MILDERDPIAPQKTEPTLGHEAQTPSVPLGELHIEGDYKPSWLADAEPESIWGKRLLAFGAAAAAITLLAAGGFWLSNEQKSQKALEVLAQSSRSADAPAAAIPAPVPAPVPPPVESTIPPLVMLPPEEVKKPAPVVRAVARAPVKFAKTVRKALPVKKVVAKRVKHIRLAKAAPKKPLAKVAARRQVRTLSPAGAPRKPKPVALRAKTPPAKRACRSGDLARDCRPN